MHDAVVVALTTPVRIGIYDAGALVEELYCDENSSEALPKLFKKVLEHYDVARLVYANGPGSFMAIKIAYLFLKTLSIVKRIPLFGIDAFYFNGGRPIKAVGKLHFVKTAAGIVTEPLAETLPAEFTLPPVIDFNQFSEDASPFYGIGAIG